MTTDLASRADADDVGAPKPDPRRKRVLFACTWNATRSPMAAALAEQIASDSVWAASVGVHGGRPVDVMAVQAMAELGLDIGGHRPSSMTDLEAAGGDMGAFDLIISLSAAAREQAEQVARFTPVRIEHWAIEDPTRAEGDEEARLAAYRRVRDRLSDAVSDRFLPKENAS